MHTVLNGVPVGLAHLAKDKEPVEHFGAGPLGRTGRHPATRRNDPYFQIRTGGVFVRTGQGPGEKSKDKTIYRKNLKRVVYVLGDVAGTAESPVYPILKMKERIKEISSSRRVSNCSSIRRFSPHWRTGIP